ncbi:S41 family peptidase [Flavobacterium sp. TAB 87]|uniref:S41 family peptidase n=1 Tax=Flavobacterium sp. TAB 87 TaxID=1729581 RepID=UPI00076BFEFE|nr:S41 family peptidase [Flavobacterium sp. TAB 87]KVV15375.1 Tail-specific protease precursor [Flavobacterium sp. TAB 87]
MKSTLKIIAVFLFASLTFYSCQDQDDIDLAKQDNLEVQDFIWKGLNQYYLWQADVPDLADNRFANQGQLNSFLRNYTDPFELFDALRVNPKIDRFSWMVKDYTALEQSFQGITTADGMEFGLSYKSSGSSEIFGYVRYIVPNSDASKKDIKRGDIFVGVNGTQLTDSNYQSLLNLENYTLNLGDNNGGTFTSNGKTVALTKGVLAENPIAIHKVIESGSHKIGYIMYNGFYADYDKELNNVFGELKAAGVTDLVLDLRYNGGGSVQTATRLASMITGQFDGKVFSKQEWNAKFNEYFKKEDPELLKNYFTKDLEGQSINSLNLSKVYILTTKSSASASELVINGLKSYIDVVQIGDVTTGKNVGSVTLYDSPTFTKKNVNPNHKYAMQPIVLKIVNANDFGEYYDGLVPTYELKESLSNLGILGELSEPLLSTAVGKITGTQKLTKKNPSLVYKYFTDNKAMNNLNQMFIEKAPEGLLRAL